MVDFSKKLKNKVNQIVKNPIKIYESLDRQTEKVGPLRDPQQKVLQEWFDSRLEDKNVILKLNTGAGKTLIGLLMLESKRRQNHRVEVFLCNNSNLIKQTIHQANLFGIYPVEMDQDNSIPAEVISGDKLLVTSVQKVFNGKSVFEHADPFEIDTMIIDDAHASAELIKQSCTMTITKSKNAQLYTDLFDLLSDGLSSQGQGTFEDLKNNNSNATFDQAFLPVPYWTWIDKCTSITRLISARSDKSTEISFVWPILKNCLEKCNCIVSSNSIEITPIKYPLDFYTSYINAKQRILMSATTASDSVLINDLDIDEKSVRHPLVDSEEKWSGEKMVIIPSLISDTLDRSTVVKLFGKLNPKSLGYGITAIVPTYYKTNDWKEYGATIGKKDNLQQALTNLHSGDLPSTLVLVNRYDGVDLPDNDTRILILDSLPKVTSLYDNYVDSMMPNSSEALLRKAQRIEQGMGRSVRADTDYSVIIFTGPDLVHFIRNPKLQEYFSNQTLKQIEIGIDTSKEAQKETKKDVNEPDEPQSSTEGSLEAAKKSLSSLLYQSLNRDQYWKAYYQEQMATVDYNRDTHQDLKYLIKKSNLMKLAVDPMTKNEKFNTEAQDLVDNYCDSDEERGWYLQLMAQVSYRFSKSKSNSYQKAAYRKNHKLLLPDSFNPVEKMKSLVAQKRLKNIINQIKSYGRYENFYNSVVEICSNLSFNTAKKDFEESMDEIGRILGFKTSRPDEDYKQGPDHLWSVKDNLFFVIEDKSEVSEQRDRIYKSETGQMNNSNAWFKRNYPGTSFKSFLIIPTLYPDPAGGFNDDVRIIRQNSLNKLKKNLTNFVMEFKDLDPNSLLSDEIAEFIRRNHLEVDNFAENYSEAHK